MKTITVGKVFTLEMISIFGYGAKRYTNTVLDSYMSKINEVL